MQLKNRTILITGGASGIGLAFAKQFIKHNNRVIVCGRHEEKLKQAKAQIPQLITLRCDINRDEDLNALVSELSSRYPELDTLINNAGIQQQLDLTGNEVSDFEIINEINTNLSAHIRITLRLYSLLSANENPAIIFTGSALGIVPKFNVPIYSAAKAGLHSFVQSLRHQARPGKVQVYEIFPELVDTPMTKNRTNETKMDSDTFARAVMLQLSRNREEIYIGKTRLLQLVNRLSPQMAMALMNKPVSRNPEW